MTVSQVLTTFQGNIARTNLFTVSIPSGGGASLSFRAKGAQLPATDMGIIEVPYRGRKIKVPGSRSFAEWTVTVMETDDMGIRKALENWVNTIDNAASGGRGNKMEQVSVTLEKATGGGSAIKFTLHGAFPTNVSAIDLSFDEQTAPLEYQVTFNYTYHTVD